MLVLLTLAIANALPAFSQAQGTGGGGRGLTGSGGAETVPGMSDDGLGPRDRSAPGLEGSGLVLPTPASLPGPIDADQYIVGVGDLLMLQLWGRVSRNLTLEVGPEGVLLLPGSGTMKVHGLTLSAVRKMVIGRMQGEFRGVNMDLRLIRPRTFRIYLTGQVRVPGPYDANGAQRVTDLLRSATFLEDASRRRIEVLHVDGTREVADLELFLRTGDRSHDPYLRDGDILNVPVATDFVYAEGALARPGRMELGTSDSLLTLFRLAGDPMPSADAERALLVRFTRPFQPESLYFGLAQVYGRSFNPRIQEGDRLYVYFIPQYHLQHQASILGEVARPGVYPIHEGRHRLSDLVAAAGGFLPGADLSSIRVNRRTGGASEKDPELDRLLRLSRNELTATEYEVLRTKLANLREDFRVDWNRLVGNKGDLDLLLRDGDLVRVERLVSSVRVDGEVRRPGILNFVPDQGVDDYVAQAGGFSERAWKSKVRVTRAVTGQTLLAKDVKTLDPGDLVWVPEKRDASIWQQSSVLLATLTSIATITIAIITVVQVSK